MSHIPIPPLLSSTPPPIDFDDVADNDSGAPPQLSEDTDDEFGDFAVVIETAEILSLPDTPVHQESRTSTTSSGYIDPLPEFDDIILCDKLPAAPLKVKDNIENSFNRQDNSTNQVDQEPEEDTIVFPNPKSSTTTLISQEEGMFVKDDIKVFEQNINCSENNYQSDTICIKNSQNSDDHVYFEDEDDVETKYDDSSSLPSLKFDTFSINSKRSTTSPTISDDIVACTDDISAFQLDEHIAEQTEQTSTILEKKASSSNLAKISHSSKDEEETAHHEIRKATDNDNNSSIYNENDDKLEKSEKNEEHLKTKNDVIATFEADFSQFTSFEATKSTEVIIKNVETERINLECQPIDDPPDDDFDDFQDFTQAEMISSKTLTLNDDNNEDEFGDFNNEVKDCAKARALNFNSPNLFDKLHPILALMFPVDENSSSFVEQTSKEDKQKLEDINDTNLNQIDSAKALDYQWSNSEVRHALIKSLGIDSRNILYGEKWNAMPRFAANLSFNPLEPIKPDTNFKADGNMKKMQTTSNDLADQKKSDVPAVEFDWDSSALVNPLDGSKEVIHEKSTEKIYPSQSREFDEPPDGQSISNAITNDYCNGQQTYQAFDCPTTATTIQSITESAAAMTPTATTTTTNSNSNSISSAPTTVSALNNTFAISFDKKNNEKNKPSQKLEFSADDSNDKSQKLTTEKMDVSETGDMEEKSDHSVLATSIYTGPLKETHIFTPSKSECLVSLPLATPKTSECNKLEPIDFDYEMAAAGMIIDEKVVKKEYRDVEYNPGFGLDFKHSSNSESGVDTSIANETTTCDDFQKSSNLQRVPTEILQQSTSYSIVEHVPPLTAALEVDDEFSDFQSVPAFEIELINSSLSSQEYKTNSNIQKSKLSRTDTPVSTTDEMILSPAILLPQSIQIEKKPKIEWPSPGINPEELARIEELFPQPKTRLSSQNDTTSANKVLSPKAGGHGSHNALTISEKVANQSNDDDDWSEFMSVPALNNFGSVSQSIRPVPSYSHLTAHLKRSAPDQYHNKRQPRSIDSSFSNDEEWSDFVSSAPAAATNDGRPTDKIHGSQQFNSAAWHNANFYNNPLSYYHQQNFSKNVTNFPKKLPAMNHQRQEDQQQSRFNFPNSNNNNNNNSIKKYNYNNINQYLNNNDYLQQQHQQQQQQHDYQRQHHQQIQLMNDFSSVNQLSYQIDGHPTRKYVSGVSGNNVAGHGKTANAFGSAKVAPCISLIPDLAFVAPPSSTSFITSLPGTDFANMKK